MIPSGLTLYFSEDAFGLHYRHPEQDIKVNTGVRVSLNKEASLFDKEADDACEAMHRFAKATNKKFGIDNKKSLDVIECEKSMVDGKYQCGYSIKASETAVELRSMLKEGYHTGYKQKPVKSRLNEEGDIIW